MAKKSTPKKTSSKTTRSGSPRMIKGLAESPPPPIAPTVTFNSFTIDAGTRVARAEITPGSNEMITFVELHKDDGSGTFNYLQEMEFKGGSPKQTWKIEGDEFDDPNEPEPGKDYRCKCFSEIHIFREQDSDVDEA